MAILPGWNSVESATRVHDVSEIAGIVFLGLLVIAEIITYVYGHRRDSLVTAAAVQRERESATEIGLARSRIGELEKKQQPRSISAEQRAAFIEATKGGSFGPVILATRTALPSKEQEDFTMQLRNMLDEAGFGNRRFDIVNGFTTGVDPQRFLGFVSHGDAPPPYFSNLAGGLHKIGLISPDVPVAVNNPNAKEGVLYLLIPEKQ